MDPVNTPSLRPLVGHARRRALTAFVSLSVGIIVADAGLVQVPAWASFAAALVLVLVAAAAARASRQPWIGFIMGSAVACLGSGVYTLRVLESPRGFLGDRWASLAPGDRALVTVEGIVVARPESTKELQGELARFVRWDPGVVFTVRADTLITDTAILASGDVRCVMGDPSNSPPAVWPVQLGARVRVTGLASPSRQALNPGEEAATRFDRQSRLAGSVSISSPELVVPLAHESGLAWAVGKARWSLDRVRTGAVRVLGRVGDIWGDQAGATAAALLLGQNEPGLEDVRESFTRLGILHALAISGFHLSVLTAMAITTLRVLSRGEGPDWLEPAIIGSLLVLYALMLPTQAPITRAVIMGLVLLGSESAGRRYDRLTVLFWVSAALLVWRPADLWSLGFQLSCGLTGLLLWLGTPAFTRLWGVAFVVPGVRTGGVWDTALHWFRASISSSVLCWLASVPLVWSQTGYLSPFAVPATVLVSPVLVLAMGAGYLVLIVSAALGWVVPAIGDAGAWAVGFFTHAAIQLSHWIDRVPGSGLTGPPIHWWAAAFSTASIVLFFALGRRRSWMGWSLVVASPGVCAVSIVISTRLALGTQARIDTFAVGDGSCHLIRVGRDAVLWDAGSLQYAAARRSLPRALRAAGAWRVRTAVLSHGDFDHFGVLPELAEHLGVRQLLVGERFLERAVQPDSPAAALLARLHELGVTVHTVSAGASISLDGGSLTFLAPLKQDAFARENDYSLIARLDVAPAAPRALALLTGDAQSAAIGALRDRQPALKADWVEAPHHGAANPDAAAWVASLGPRMVAQSTGPQRMRSAAWHAAWTPVIGGFALYQTPEHGAVFAEFSLASLRRHGSFRESSVSSGPAPQGTERTR